MDRIQKIEEALSIIWEEFEKKNCQRDQVKKLVEEKTGEGIFEELVAEKFITIESSAVNFTPVGEVRARSLTRRQRLAERLLIDVLDVPRKEMDSSACELEHILSKEVEESICTLLGHPKECPHGLPIPQGECCVKAKGLLESIVVPLSKLAPGDSGKIVYLLTHKHPQLHKLMSLGITPGVTAFVHQIMPSFVIQVDQTQVALEEEIAREIYVKKLHTI